MAITTIAPVVGEKGVSAPTYDQILEWLKTQYRNIYGNDVYLENDSMDGQFLGVLALEFSHVGAACVQLYNSFNPLTSDSDALSRNVKINGIHRALSTFSTVDVVVTGTPGTLIKNGVVGDASGNKWLLPNAITISSDGENTVTAIATVAGAILAQAGAVNLILTPTRGWQSVLNPNSSSIGQDIESDSKLRQRQALSVAIPSMSLVEGMRGAILSLKNVTRCRTFENKLNTIDENGLPPKSICVVVLGGDTQEIAKIMHIKKSMGCAWYGNTSSTILNVYNEPHTVSLYRPDVKNISFHISLKSTQAYSADTADSISKNLAEYVNELDIGDKVMMNKLYAPANLYGSEQSKTYDVEVITILVEGSPISGDYTLPFGCVAYCDPATISIEVISG